MQSTTHLRVTTYRPAEEGNAVVQLSDAGTNLFLMALSVGLEGAYDNVPEDDAEAQQQLAVLQTFVDMAIKQTRQRADVTGTYQFRNVVTNLAYVEALLDEFDVNLLMVAPDRSGLGYFIRVRGFASAVDAFTARLSEASPSATRDEDVQR